MTDDDLRALYLSAERRWLDGWAAGPTVEGQPLRRGNRAPEVEVLDENGARIPLSSLWTERPALLMLWRHLGCGCGLDRNDRLKNEIDEYRAAGLNVAICVPGDVERAAVYKERYEVPVPMMITPDYAAHRAFGLGHWSVEQALYDESEEYCDLTVETGTRFQESRRAQGRVMVDDPWMQAGEFVVDPTAVIKVSYLYNYCEDYPDPRIFLTAARLISP